MKKISILILIAVVLLTPLLSLTYANAENIEANSPQIQIYPSTIINPNTQVMVIGKGWTPNGTVRINLILPDGSLIQGVSSSTVNATGGFQAIFTAPNVYGTGYIEAVEGALQIKQTVFFNGNNAVGQLQITYSPSTVYVNQEVTFMVQASFLSNKNYVLDTTVFYINKEVIYYSVLHQGYGIVQVSFDQSGKYFVTFHVEGTIYNKTIELEVKSGSTPSNPTGNLTMSISAITSSNSALVKISGKDGYAPSGKLRIIMPDGTLETATVLDGIGKFPLTSSGQYVIQFIDNKTGDTITKNWEYQINLQIQTSGFQNSNQCSITIYENGKPYTGSATIMVTKPDGTTSNIQYNGMQVTFTATESGTYTFSVTLFGTTAKSSAVFTDTPVFSNVEAYQTPDKQYIVITGQVYGKYSQKPLSGVTVIATSWQLTQGKSEAVTDQFGNFKIQIPLTSEDRGKLVNIQLKAGTSTKQLSLETQQTLADNMGWIIGGIIILIITGIIIAGKLGYIKIFKKKQKSGKMFNYGGGVR